MDLDNLALFTALDAQNMLAHIDNLPQQLQNAWELGQDLPLPTWRGIRQVIIAGMGGSAIGADLLAAYAAPICSVPIYTHRDYDLPAWVRNPDTLVVVSSHSGNTEEALSALDTALNRNCRLLALTTGGKLAHLASERQIPIWQFRHFGQPRAAVGFSFGLLLAALHRLGLLPDPTHDLIETVEEMKNQQAELRATIPVTRNPAKRLAGQLIGRWVTVIGSGHLAPVARRWKCQINELAKAWAQFEFLPEADHNTLTGILNPDELLSRTMVLFLKSHLDHPRNQLRNELTRRLFMLQGLNTDFILAKGNTPLAQLWTCLHLGDYVAYYLAIAYGVDPTPVDILEEFKRELRAEG